MRKKTIVILYILGLVLTGIAVVALVASSAAAAASSQSCYDTYTDSYYNCTSYSSGTSTALGVGFLFGIGLSIVGGVLGTIAWIGVLIKQGKQEQWGWFVCTLLFSGITTLIYLIAVPETPQSLVPTYVPVYQPFQPPTQYQQPYQDPYQQPYQPQQPYQDPYQQPPNNDPYRPY